MHSPEDITELAALLAQGQLCAPNIRLILGKTEGNGGMNDFTRALAVRAVASTLAPYLHCAPHEVEDQVLLSFSGGTEGVVTPHMLIFTVDSAETTQTAAHQKRLALAVGRTRAFAPQEIGRQPMVEETARVVRALIAQLPCAPADVEMVHIKGALPNSDTEARCTMAYARGASALGVGLALQEIPPHKITDDAIGVDWSLYSAVASTSAKPGLPHSEIAVFANVAHWTGNLIMTHEVMQDILDIGAIHRVLAQAGLVAEPQLNPRDRERLVGLFAKADPDPRHTIRGQRHTMGTDSDISDMRMARCVVASLIAGITGETAIYVSTRAEHHGPQGGGPVACISRVP